MANKNSTFGPKEETLLQKLEKAAKLRQLSKHSDESLEWFRKNAKKAVSREEAQMSLLDQQRELDKRSVGKKTPIGKLYTFAYDAKHKLTLPYFDRFPLAFYVGPAAGGFYGLNMHYLSPHYRAILFDALLSIETDPRYAAHRKLKLSYDLLKNASEFRLFKPTFHHYLAGQLDSRIVEIPYPEWEAALFLPTADFVGAVNSKVWSDSMLKL